MKIAALILVFLLASVQAQDICSCLSLASAAYTGLVRGSKFLRDVMYGAGALNRLYSFLVDGKPNSIEDIDTPTDEMTFLKEESNFNEEPNSEMSQENYLMKDFSMEKDPKPVRLEELPVLAEKPAKIDLCKMNDKLEIVCDSDAKKRQETTPYQEEVASQPVFQGCGDVGFHLDNSGLPVDKMSSCCKKHLDCYSSCRSQKRRCDRNLKRCMQNSCKQRSLDRVLRRSCQAASKLLLMSTLSKSPQLYKEAQQKLRCRGKNDRYRKRR